MEFAGFFNGLLNHIYYGILLIAVNKTEGRHHIELVNRRVVKMSFILFSFSRTITQQSLE